ncbi:MAG TPA: AMP-binding protein [Prolixibacteraceae bacterium]|nr:AMP-binding protein [Prolixibacteraceae bacterium]
MKTIIELFETSVEKYAGNIYLMEKRNGKYEGITYGETREQVLRFAAGLIQLGLGKGDRVGLISEGRPDWAISELGILYAGGINVPLSTKLDAPPELIFRMNHSEARLLIVSRNQAHKAEEIRASLPLLEKVIYLDGKENPGPDDLTFEAVKAMGDELLKSDPGKLEKIWKRIEPGDIANISYTSGTTADPKGIMLSQLNYAANTIQANTLMTIDPNYRTLTLLPWDHSFAHTACMYCFMYNGAAVASVDPGRSPMEALRNVPKNIMEVKPHIMMSVPALAKNFRKNIESGIAKKGKITEGLFRFALKVAYSYNGIGWDKGKGTRALLKPLLLLFDKILFSKIRENFGGEMKFFIGGGALLDTELQRFFYAIGIPMCQGYGLSESSPVISSNSLDAIKFGSSGKLVKYMELKIVDDKGKELPLGEKGEITIKGDNVMVGYWKNPKATEETIIDGWLHTGDMGFMDADGFLHVLGRFKSLLISNDGEKFSPEGIEEAMVNQSPFLDQVMLYNNQNPYTVAMVVPHMNAIRHELEKRGISEQDPGADEAVLKLVQEEVDAYKKGGRFEGMFPERWLPTSIALLPEPFTEQNGLINSTMKMVRGKITKYFAKELDYLYKPEAKSIVNPVNLEAVRKFKSGK